MKFWRFVCWRLFGWRPRASIAKPTQHQRPIADLTQWSINNWLRLPFRLRRRCIDHLHTELLKADDGKLVLDQWCLDKRVGRDIGDGDPWFHHGSGMWVRNTLREVLRDDGLYPVEQQGGDFAQNWDDYYKGALDQMVGEILARSDQDGRAAP